MKIYLTDQKKNFPIHLDLLKLSKIIPYDKDKLNEKTSTIDIETNVSFSQLDTTFFFDYNIFPPYIMSFLTQWGYENRDMQVGDTIVQQILLPPNKIFSQKIIMGVRITEIIKEVNRIGFSYETLEGHVEKGISTFTFEQLEGKIIFKIHTFSASANFLSKALEKIFSVPYQKYCTKKALDNVKSQVEGKKY